MTDCEDRRGNYRADQVHVEIGERQMPDVYRRLSQTLALVRLYERFCAERLTKWRSTKLDAIPASNRNPSQLRIGKSFQPT